jgi:hypothetical protein
MAKDNEGQVETIRFDSSYQDYDPADLRAIRADANRMGGLFDDEARFDDNTVFFARALDFIKARVYDRKYPEMKGGMLVPDSTDVPEYAETVTTRVYDEVGIAKVISNYADDLPRADVRAREYSVTVKTIGDAYGYNINELRASQATGNGLDARKAAAARRAIEQKLNRIKLRGDALYGLLGLLNNPNIPAVAAITGNWGAVATTGDNILAELNALYLAIRNQSNGTHSPNRVAFGPVQMAAATTKIVSDTMGVTAWDFFQRQHPEIAAVEAWEFKGAGTGATDMVLMYDYNEENLWHQLVMGFNQLPPEARNLEFVVSCMARSGGVTIQYPLGFAKMSGV